MFAGYWDMFYTNQEREFLQALLPSETLQVAVDWIQSHLDPEDVFTEDQLSGWAVNNGYTNGE